MNMEAKKTPQSMVNVKKRKALIGVNVAVMILISIAIFVFVSYINDRHYYRFDFTASGKYSLSGKTKKIVKGLEEPVFVTTLLQHNPDYRFHGQILDILEEYKYLSNKIKVTSLNPFTDQTKITELSEQLKMDLEQIQLNSIIFVSGDKSKHVLLTEVIERTFPFKFKGEEVFTSAILNVTQDSQTTIYYTKGHGERNFEDFERPGLGGLASAIKRANYKVLPLDLLKKKQVPEDCDLLFIAGPTKSFSTEETNYIRDYLGTTARLVDEKGELKDGKLLVMLEPALGSNTTSGLKALLGEYGIMVRDDTVVYNKVNLPLFGMQTVSEIYVSDKKYPDHEITQDMRSLTTLFFGSCVVSAAPLTDSMAFGAKPLAEAPDSSWGETEVGVQKKPKYNQDVDVSAPITLAVASELRDAPKNPQADLHTPPHASKLYENMGKKGARVVVFGDVDFAANAFANNPGNRDLVLNSISWLARKEKELGISAKAPDVRRAIIKPAQMTFIFWSSIAGLPFIGILVGGIVWWIRRR